MIIIVLQTNETIRPYIQFFIQRVRGKKISPHDNHFLRRTQCE